MLETTIPHLKGTIPGEAKYHDDPLPFNINLNKPIYANYKELLNELQGQEKRIYKYMHREGGKSTNFHYNLFKSSGGLDIFQYASERLKSRCWLSKCLAKHEESILHVYGGFVMLEHLDTHYRRKIFCLIRRN